MARKTLTEKQILAEINRNVSHAFRLDREYIIVCNEHKGVFAGALLFWGHKTEDNEKDSGFALRFRRSAVYLPAMFCRASHAGH